VMRVIHPLDFSVATLKTRRKKEVMVVHVG
jgi:hypothetical protein